MAGLFYDYDTDDTASMNSLDSDSSGDCLFNHRAALAEQGEQESVVGDDESEFGPDRALPIFQHYEERLQKLESTLSDLAFHPDRDWAEGYALHLETNDRPTILAGAAHFKARYERFLNQYPEMRHGIDTNAANEPFDDHGDDDTDEDQQPALNQSPPDAPVVGSPVVIESVSELVLGLGSVSISPSGLAPSYAPIAGSAVVQEPEGEADVAEPPARRRRVLPETFFGFPTRPHLKDRECLVCLVRPPISADSMIAACLGQPSISICPTFRRPTQGHLTITMRSIACLRCGFSFLRTTIRNRLCAGGEHSADIYH